MPDALLLFSDSVAVALETKINALLDPEQLRRHAQALSQQPFEVQPTRRAVLALTRDGDDKATLITTARERFPADVALVWMTWQRLADLAEQLAGTGKNLEEDWTLEPQRWLLREMAQQLYHDGLAMPQHDPLDLDALTLALPRSAALLNLRKVLEAWMTMICRQLPGGPTLWFVGPRSVAWRDLSIRAEREIPLQENAALNVKWWVEFYAPSRFCIRSGALPHGSTEVGS